MRFIHILTLIVALTLSACGGGGGSPGSSVSGGGAGNDSGSATREPATLEIVSSSNSLQSSSASKLTLDVTVKDASSLAVPGVAVSFKATSGILTGANPVPISNANGVVSVDLSPGGDATNRDIEITATAGAISKKITIPVTGSSISIAGAGSALVSTIPLTYSVKATDSGGKPLVNSEISVSSTLGNLITPSTATTNSSGLASVNYTPSKAGIDTLKVAGLGATAQSTVIVSGEDFTFISPGAGVSFPTNTPSSVVVRYKSGGVGVAGKSVTFSSTRGSVNPATAITDVNGDATTFVTSSTAGPATVAAQSDSARSTLSTSFVGTVPASIVLQANPSAIFPNPTGSSVNQAAMSVLVLDKDGNPVPDQVVNFSAVRDASNGNIVPGTSTTDKNGAASVQFISGPLSTATSGVTLQASLQSNPAISSTTSLTVNGEALFLSIGTASNLLVKDSVTYQKEFQVYVTDANGVAVANKQLVLSVLPTYYMVGSYKYDSGEWKPDTTIGTQKCPNEDIDNDGVLDLNPTEDKNSNGALDPGKPVVVSPGIVTTDTSGFAKFSLTYAKSYAEWVQTRVTARALVGGTESIASRDYVLEMTQEDAKSDAGLANRFSPFAVATAGCPAL